MKTFYSNKQQKYTLNSIIRCIPPQQASGTGWYEYKIVQGENIITGYKCGEYIHVLQSVEENIAQLNLRQYGNYGPMQPLKKT